jgi:hypothetical protein
MGLNIKFEILCYDFVRLYHFKQRASDIVHNRYYVIMFSKKFYYVDVFLFHITITVTNYRAQHHVHHALYPLYLEEFPGPCHGNVSPCKQTPEHVGEQIWKTPDNDGCAGALKFLPLPGNQILLPARTHSGSLVKCY